MITALYTSLCALLIVKLSSNVITLRRQLHVGLGDGGQPALQAAIRSQGNATEYIPISLILMILLEWAGGPWWLIHLAGITLISSRLLHASALKNSNVRRRVLGMRITFYLIIALAALNIFYLIIGYFSG
ncbi:MAPEG family protein [Methylophaga sp. OBS4]|uniref:MAPEG family protein n=1 Tax=Methylophaga sp. OBS4 TaxID=2991935 RepID=UPI0022512D99|nr:MAPEG family protein [Methylophaga sp. OBS4]MCX4187461.1 MAPEG family protein [Methylophaga sp. OBS4]